ncbi:MAG: signal peptidase II [Acutalibacteraceae bacterium]|nr:signal peptidase II [Clostridia bacterium]MEE1330342.1 signal peptidase II [Acutalibacteraceae bacterium]
MIVYIAAVLGGLVVLGLDQYTKYLVSTHFVLGESYGFIKGFIDLTYIHNTGAAWGMLSGKKYILIAVTLAVMAVCIALFVKYAKGSRLMLWALTLVLSGGIGNMIDRIFRDGKVIDFLHFEFFPSFPVFNIADCAIVLGAVLLALYFILDIAAEKKQNTDE